MGMEQERYWMRFTNSGKVEDYLAYRDAAEQGGYMQNMDKGRNEHERNRDSDWYDPPVITDTRI